MAWLNTGAMPTVRPSDIYGGQDNSVFPSPAPSPIQTSAGGIIDDGTTRAASYWLIGMIVVLILLRLVYESAA